MRNPTSKRETKVDVYTDASESEAGAKGGIEHPHQGAHGITPAFSCGAYVKMEITSASTNATTPQAIVRGTSKGAAVAGA